MSNSEIDAGSIESARITSWEKKGTEYLIQEKMQKMTEKSEESPGNIESESPLLDIIESNFKELKRKDNNEGDNENKPDSEPIARIRLAYDALKDINLKEGTREPAKPYFVGVDRYFLTDYF